MYVIIFCSEYNFHTYFTQTTALYELCTDSFNAPDLNYGTFALI